MLDQGEVDGVTVDVGVGHPHPEVVHLVGLDPVHEGRVFVVANVLRSHRRLLVTKFRVVSQFKAHLGCCAKPGEHHILLKALARLLLLVKPNYSEIIL